MQGLKRPNKLFLFSPELSIMILNSLSSLGIISTGSFLYQDENEPYGKEV